MPALFSRASDRSSAGAHYTGLAVEGPPVTSAPYLYGANATGEIDVFDKNFNLVNSFAADSSPAPFTPYGIRAIGDQLYVTYAAPPPVALGGIADVCDLSTSPTVHLHKTPSRWSLQFPHAKSCPERPWGLALAPSHFGPLSNTLLVGNVNDGHINGLDPSTGMVAPCAPLTLTNGQTFATPGLWALQFGGGLRPVNGRANQLFFTAGPGPSPAQIFSQGVFGVISPATSEVTVEKSARALNPNGLTLAICSRPISAQRCGPGAAEDGLSRRVGPEPFHGCWFTSGYPGEKV